jgi:hypothetical protein
MVGTKSEIIKDLMVRKAMLRHPMCKPLPGRTSLSDGFTVLSHPVFGEEFVLWYDDQYGSSHIVMMDEVL